MLTLSSFSKCLSPPSSHSPPFHSLSPSRTYRLAKPKQRGEKIVIKAHKNEGKTSENMMNGGELEGLWGHASGWLAEVGQRSRGFLLVDGREEREWRAKRESACMFTLLLEVKKVKKLPGIKEWVWGIREMGCGVSPSYIIAVSCVILTYYSCSCVFFSVGYSNLSSYCGCGFG